MVLPLSLTGKRWTPGRDFRSVHDASPQNFPSVFLQHLRDMRGSGLEDAPLPFAHPDQMPPDLPRAVERIRRAVRDGETVGIADGITAVTQLIRAFHRRGLKPIVYLPHRQNDGYGLKEASLRFFLERNVTLLLTVDTGISSYHELVMAAQAGVDVIIVDHHYIPPELPPAFARIHPGLAPVPGTQPSAAGAAFGLVAALEREEGMVDAWSGRDEDLALAAIGTVADLVELSGTNRTLVRAGLAAIAAIPGGPLRDLLTQSGIVGAPSSRDLAFRIAPRLNAAGRMADPRTALQALLGDRNALAELEVLNRERQAQTREILRGLEHTMAQSTSAFLTVAGSHYPAGILGLIAGRLTETLGCPSMVVQVQGDACVASLRSIPGFHVTEALQGAADLLTSFGGHAMAAGCTFLSSSLPELRERLNTRASSLLTPEELVPQLPIDAVLDPAAVTLLLCESLTELEPFGQGNPEPRFLLPGVCFATLKRIGKDFAHLQGSIGPLKAVGFRLSPIFERIPQTCDVACRIGIDTWNGNRRPQIFLEDIRPAVPVAAEAPIFKHQAP